MRATPANIVTRHAALIGKRFTELTISRIFREGGKYVAEVSCSCGTSKSIRLSHLEAGATKSCGCLFIAAARQMGLSNVTHGMKKTPEYRVWTSMKQRCDNPAHRAFESYGGRGITVCKRWYSFERFYSDMGPRPSPRHSIDRTNNNRGYSPSNCMWVAPEIQNYNKRNTRRIVAFGEELPIAAWSERTGLGRSTIRERLRRGWTPERAVSQAA